MSDLTPDEFDDLIGGTPKPAPKPEPAPGKRRPGRPTKAEAAAREAEKRRAAQPTGQVRQDASVIQALLNPVTIGFLSTVMEMDRATVTKKLAPLPPLGMHRGGTPTYSFKQAMSYLAPQRLDAGDIIKKITANDLPPSLQKDVWDARLKMQKWKQAAGELWPTEDVLEVLGEAFKRLKTTTQLWIEQIEESNALTPAVREELIGLVDGLQLELHRSLVEMPKEKATPSQLGEIEGTDLDD